MRVVRRLRAGVGRLSCVLQFRSCLVDSSDGHGRGPMVSCVVMMYVGVAAAAVRMASGIEYNSPRFVIRPSFTHWFKVV